MDVIIIQPVLRTRAHAHKAPTVTHNMGASNSEGVFLQQLWVCAERT